MERERVRIAKTTLKKKVWGIPLSNFKTFYDITVHKGKRYIDQWKRTESRYRPVQTWSNMIFNKYKDNSMKMKFCPASSIGRIRYL